MAGKKKNKKQRPSRLVVLRKGSPSSFRENEPFRVDAQFANDKKVGDPGQVVMRSINQLKLKGGGQYAESGE